MFFTSRARRLVHLVHRWTGIAGCLLMALWFISGVVMLYVGYPKLTPWERLAALPPLSTTSCCATLERALGDAAPSTVGLVLTTVGGEASYVFTQASNGADVLTARDGIPLPAVTPEAALREAGAFAKTKSLRHLGEIHEDRWTHSRGLDPHRPLHQIRVGGEAPGLLYVSSATGQVVMDVPLVQQRWNYVGAWLHWLYMFREHSVDPVWTWLVIALSAMCTITAITGMTVGVWRWRFRGRYKSGQRTPYREGWMRWHHVAGLALGAFVCTWIFSGLMSMNPFGVFSPTHDKPDLSAYEGESSDLVQALARPQSIIRALNQAGFRPVELQWHRLAGEEYVLAYDQAARTRVVRATANDMLGVGEAWRPADVVVAARSLFRDGVTASRTVNAYDRYYYQRHPEAMNGSRAHGLPAQRLDFADPGHTRVYIDLRTGKPVLSLSQSERIGRWLFYFLHSWDTPPLLAAGTARELAIIALSLGGFAVSLTGMVIGWRRARRYLA